MRYVIEVRDPRRAPGRIGWLGTPSEPAVEGPHPTGLKGYGTKIEAQRRMLLIGMRFRGAKLTVRGFGPRSAE